MSDARAAVYLGAQELHGGWVCATWSTWPAERVCAFLPIESARNGGVDLMGERVVGMVRASKALPNDWTAVAE